MVPVKVTISYVPHLFCCVCRCWILVRASPSQTSSQRRRRRPACGGSSCRRGPWQAPCPVREPPRSTGWRCSCRCVKRGSFYWLSVRSPNSWSLCLHWQAVACAINMHTCSTDAYFKMTVDRQCLSQSRSHQFVLQLAHTQASWWNQPASTLLQRFTRLNCDEFHLLNIISVPRWQPC